MAFLKNIWRILFHRIPCIELAKPIILEKFSCVINCDPLVAWFCGSYKMHLCYLQNNRLWQNFENPFQLWQSFQKFFQQHHSWSFFPLLSPFSLLLLSSHNVKTCRTIENLSLEYDKSSYLVIGCSKTMDSKMAEFGERSHNIIM